MLREKMPHNLDFKCSEKALHLWIKMYLYSHLLNATLFFLTVFHDHVKTTSYKWFGVFCSVPPADRQLCEQIGHGHGSAAAVPGHPGVHGAQQSGSLPQGGTGDHHWTAHPASSGVRGGGRDQYELDLCSLICSAIIKASQTARKDDHCVVYNHISGSFSDSRTDQDIQTYTIAVINALFLKAPEEKRQVRLHCAHTALSHRAVHHFQDAVSLTRYIHMWSHQHFSTVTLYCVCVYVCVPESCVHSTSQIRL